MKHSFYTLLLLLLSIAVYSQGLPFGFPVTDRTKISVNAGWKFKLGQPEAKYYKVDTDDNDWETVSVPHTLYLTSLTLDMLEDDQTQSVFQRDVGWYRKDVTISGSQKKVYLEFEGAHQVTDLWVNGKYVGQHAVGGYTPFHFDITAFVNRGASNQITLLVDNRKSEIIPPDPGPFDYIKFGGLYRDVYLVETSKVHVTFNWESLNSGVSITTPTIDLVNKNATINVKTAVKNEEDKTVKVRLLTRVLDKEGIVVARMLDEQNILRQQEYQFNQITSLEDDVRSWGIEDPYLYRVNSVVIVDGKEIDFVENKIGLRKFELDHEKGFMLNGKPIELLGFNRHQHYPYIGDAVPNSLHYKDMLQFKEFGFNVVRTAHYPQDDALIEACDELGILVYEEAPSWISVSQNPGWWSNFDKANRTMIRNHRNHPSVVMWGAGINHRGYVVDAHNAVKQEDPTRLTASQSAAWTGWQSSGLTDVSANMLYRKNFIWDRSEPLLAMEGRRGPKAVAPFKRDPKMTGLIAWTAHAYHTFHPTNKTAGSPMDRTRSGMMTIFRYPRPQNQWYKAELTDEPFVFIPGNWVEGTDSISVFSNAQEVELFINGTSMGRQKPSSDSVFLGLDHAPFEFDGFTYKKGSVKAVAYFDQGKTGEYIIKTPGKPFKIELTVDTLGREFVADGNDILMIYARLVDKNGTTVPNAKNKVSFSVKGDGAVIGDKEDINANPMFTQYGVAPALIRAGTTAGMITIYAKSKGLQPGVAQVDLVPNITDVIRKKALPIYDFKKERVDMGAPDQLSQFGWSYWNGTDEAQNVYSFESFEGSSVRIEPASDGFTRWLGEMNVIGKYGFAYGDGTISVDDKGVNLVLQDLTKGTYRITTWHHAPRSNSDLMDPNKDKLKSMRIHQLPYETSLTASSANLIGEKEIKVKVTEGKEMQWDPPGTSVLVFISDGQNPVEINFNGTGGKGIWINAFELTEWK